MESKELVNQIIETIGKEAMSAILENLPIEELETVLNKRKPKSKEDELSEAMSKFLAKDSLNTNPLGAKTI